MQVISPLQHDTIILTFLTFFVKGKTQERDFLLALKGEVSIPKISMNVKNRTLYCGDNLYVLRGIDTESVDLIYLDPPFNSNRNYSAPIGSEAAGATFRDTWALDDMDNALHDEIAKKAPVLYHAIHASEFTHSKGMKSYLIMLAVRLLEMRRVLRSTGSIYLHCDPSASHYIKIVMDSIFGKNNFRNEIVWQRVNTPKTTKIKFGESHDTILFYVKSSKARFTPIFIASDLADIKKQYPHKDEYGYWKMYPLTAAGTRKGESGWKWRRYDPNTQGRHWAIPNSAIPEHVRLPDNWDTLKTIKKLDFLNDKNLIRHAQTPRAMPSFKRYLQTHRDTAAIDVITDIPNVKKKENTGYPTQKPLALLQRIIKASSNEGDVVLDPFCGSGTTCVAAEQLGRQWIGIDISLKAISLVHTRLER